MIRVGIEQVEEYDYLVFFNGEPYTGEVVEQGPDGGLGSLYTYDDGALDGPYREWFPDQQLVVEGEMAGGVHVGVLRKWSSRGHRVEEVRFDELGREVGRRRWDENGELAHDTWCGR